MNVTLSLDPSTTLATTPFLTRSGTPSCSAEAAIPPLLTPPENVPFSDRRFLEEVDKLFNTRDALIASRHRDLEARQQEMQEACAAYTRELQNTAAALQDNRFWGLLQKVANSFLSTFSLLFGLSLVGTTSSALAGGALISSGLLSLGNLALSESKGWEWIIDQMQEIEPSRKERLKVALPTACGILAAGLGIAGSSAAFAKGAVDFSTKASRLAQGTFSLFTTSTNLGKGMSEGSLRSKEALLTGAETEFTLSQAELDLFTNHFHTLLTEFESMLKQGKRAVQSIVQINHITSE